MTAKSRKRKPKREGFYFLDTERMVKFLPKLWWIFASLLSVSSSHSKDILVDDSLFQKIESHENRTTWNIDWNYQRNLTKTQFQSKLGVHFDFRKDAPDVRPSFSGSSMFNSLPESFDARQKWPKCAGIISSVTDQGGCSSCWAVAATSAMSDRLCIHSVNHTIQERVSAQDLLACCTECGNGCFGGLPGAAWYHWHSSGIVTGGDYGSNEGCQPYSLKPCSSHLDYLICPQVFQTPTCQKRCHWTSSTKRDYEDAKTYGNKPYLLPRNENEIMYEIFQNGPAEATFEVYQDFVLYKNGVYSHLIGDMIGTSIIQVFDVLASISFLF